MCLGNRHKQGTVLGFRLAGLWSSPIDTQCCLDSQVDGGHGRRQRVIAVTRCMDSQQTLMLMWEPFQKLFLVSAHLDARVGSAWGLTFALTGGTLRDIYGPLLFCLHASQPPSQTVLLSKSGLKFSTLKTWKPREKDI